MKHLVKMFWCAPELLHEPFIQSICLYNHPVYPTSSHPTSVVPPNSSRLSYPKYVIPPQ